MKLDELRRGLDDAGQHPEIDLVDARATVGARATRRRRRNRQLVGVAVVAVVVAVTAPIVVRDRDQKRQVTVAPTPPDNAVDGWVTVSKADAGFGTGMRFSAIATSGHSPYSLLLAGGPQLAISYSDDGVTWKPGRIPAITTGAINAISTNGETSLAIGTAGIGWGSPFVWQSEDDGRSWSVVADGAGLFGPPDSQTGRPDVSGLMDAFGMWVAWGGGSNGYAAVWTSQDGRKWQQVLDTKPPDNRPTGVGGVNVAFEGNDRLVAYAGNITWTSSDGMSWGPAVIAAVPEPFSLGTVAWGGNFAFGENELTHGQPTPLLRRADGQQSWFVDPTFLAEFPDARVVNVTRSDDAWIATGTSGAPGHPDAWVSLDGITWRSMPASLYGSPDGATTVDSSTLSLAASIGNRIVMFGTTPELDRYYMLDAPTITSELGPFRAQDAEDRYRCTFGVEDADWGADGLPNITGAQTDRVTVARSLPENRNRLLAENPDVVDITVGPGYRRAWKGEAGGTYEIVYVKDYALILHLRSHEDCPLQYNPNAFRPGVEIFYSAN